MLERMLQRCLKQNNSDNQLEAPRLCVVRYLVLLSVFLLSALLPHNYAIAADASVELSAVEKAWLQNHQEITLGYGTEFKPLLIQQPDGTSVGMVPDLIEALSSHLGINIKLTAGPLADIIEDVKAGKLDGLASIAKVGIERLDLMATSTWAKAFVTIYSHSKRAKTINSMDDLINSKVLYLEQASSSLAIRNKYKDSIEFIPVTTVLEAFNAISAGKADAFVGLNLANYYLVEFLISDVEVAFVDTSHTGAGVIGIRKDWPQLVSILNKGLAAIGEDGLRAIINKWLQLKPQQRSLTQGERAWLTQLPPLNYGALSDQYPFEEMDANGHHDGLIGDILSLLQEQLNITISKTETSQLSSLKQKLKDGSLSIAGLVPENSQTEADFIFSAPFIELAMVLVTHKDSGFFAGLDSLEKHTIAVQKDSVIEQDLIRDYPDITVLSVNDDQQGLVAVEQGQADAFIINAASADYLLRRSDSKVLKLATTTPYKQSLSFVVAKPLEKLVPILNIQLASISERERGLMLAKWLNVKIEEKTDWEKVLLWGGLSGLIVIIIIGSILYVNRRLAKEVTVRIQSEKNAIKAEKKAEDANKAKSTFLANMSHELRTPLNAVIGFSQLMQHQSDLPTHAIEDIKTIHSSGQHLLGLINDVLDMAKIEAGKTTLEETKFSCRELFIFIKQMFSQQMQQKGLKLQLEGVEELPLYIKADESKLKQSVLNLISNAYKFTTSGTIFVRAHFDKPQLIIEVEDNGSGIAEDEIEQIFEAFSQSESGRTSKQGTGLGLPISRQFARLMGGDLTVTSRKGKGSVFCLKVKVETVEAMGKSSDTCRVIGLAPGQKSYRILVVDDVELNRVILSRLLKQTGFTVETTDDGLQAIERADNWQPHLIFMDQRMPKMDGDEATRIIKAAHPEIIIIALSASVLKEAEANVVASGGDAFIRKPYKENEIFDVINKYLQVEYEIVDVKSEAASPEVPEEEKDAHFQQLLSMTDAVWCQQLKEATEVGNIDQANSLVTEIADEHTELAAGLQKLLREYKLEKINHWLG